MGQAVWSYQGDKVLIWWKKIKDGRLDPDILEDK